MARLKNGMASGSPFASHVFIPRLYAFKASSEGVLACSRGVSNFCTVLNDSPSLLRISEAVFPRASSTWFFLVTGLSFRARQRFAAGAIDRLEGQKVLRANLRYRTVEDCGARRPLAEFPRNRWCELCVGWLAHHLEGLLDLLVRDNAQEGRLL